MAADALAVALQESVDEDEDEVAGAALVGVRLLRQDEIRPKNLLTLPATPDPEPDLELEPSFISLSLGCMFRRVSFFLAGDGGLADEPL